MIISAILALAGVAAVASVINLFDTRSKPSRSVPMNVQLPGNLPIIALSTNNGNTMNFLIDSGSNISHICSDYFDALNAEILGTYEDGKVSGLGAVNTGITMCKTELLDTIGNRYKINLSISEQLNDVSRSMEEETGIKVHGLLGTDFLKDYNCVIDFKSLEVYSKK